MKIDVISIFPEYLSPLKLSLLGKAQNAGLVDIAVHDLRARLHLQVLVFESLCAMQVGSKLTLSRAG